MPLEQTQPDLRGIFFVQNASSSSSFWKLYLGSAVDINSRTLDLSNLGTLESMNSNPGNNLGIHSTIDQFTL